MSSIHRSPNTSSSGELFGLVALYGPYNGILDAVICAAMRCSSEGSCTLTETETSTAFGEAEAGLLEQGDHWHLADWI